MRLSKFILLILFMHFSLGLYAQESDNVEGKKLSKKELRKLHREEKKAERYEKHHQHDEAEVANSTEAVTTTTDQTEETVVEDDSERVEHEIDSALTANTRIKTEPNKTSSENDLYLAESEEPVPDSSSESGGSSMMGVVILVTLVVGGLFFKGSSNKESQPSKTSSKSTTQTAKVPVAKPVKKVALISDVRIRKNGFLETFDENGKLIKGMFMKPKEVFVGFTQSAFITVHSSTNNLTTYGPDCKSIKQMFLAPNEHFHGCAGNTFTTKNKMNLVKTFDMKCKKISERFV